MLRREFSRGRKSFCPEEKLSNTVTWSTAGVARSFSTAWLPMKPAPPGTNARMFRSCDRHPVGMGFAGRLRPSRPAHQFRSANAGQPCSSIYRMSFVWLAGEYSIRNPPPPAPMIFPPRTAKSRLGHIVKLVGKRCCDLRIHLLFRLPVLVEQPAELVEIFLLQCLYNLIANLLDPLEAVHSGLMIHASLVQRGVILQAKDARCVPLCAGIIKMRIAQEFMQRRLRERNGVRLHFPISEQCRDNATRPEPPCIDPACRPVLSAG